MTYHHIKLSVPFGGVRTAMLWYSLNSYEKMDLLKDHYDSLKDKYDSDTAKLKIEIKNLENDKKYLKQTIDQITCDFK